MTRAEISYPSLDTPSVLVDMDKLEANIEEVSRLAAGAGVGLRNGSVEQVIPVTGRGRGS